MLLGTVSVGSDPTIGPSFAVSSAYELLFPIHHLRHLSVVCIQMTCHINILFTPTIDYTGGRVTARTTKTIVFHNGSRENDDFFKLKGARSVRGDPSIENRRTPVCRERRIQPRDSSRVVEVHCPFASVVRQVFVRFISKYSPSPAERKTSWPRSMN